MLSMQHRSELSRIKGRLAEIQSEASIELSGDGLPESVSRSELAEMIVTVRELSALEAARAALEKV